MEKQSDACLALADRVISMKAEAENLVISPLSIHIILAMTAAGATGSTLAELLSYLNSESSEQLTSLYSRLAKTVFADGSPLGGPLLSTANGLWVDRSVTLKPAYRDIVENSYNAVAECVDFQTQGRKALEQVNVWAAKQTNGLIKEILPLDTDTEFTKLILANAVYFKGRWDQEFDASRTKYHDFYLLDGSSVRVPFMTSWKMQCVRAFDGFKVLRLPYRQGKDTRKFSMYIYLPDAKAGLPALLKRIRSEPEFIDRHLPCWAKDLSAFRIPLFKIAFYFKANEVMKELGIMSLFEKYHLTEMVDSNYPDKYYPDDKLRASRILHKAVIEVNEQGTEAAAVTVESDEDIGFSLEPVIYEEFVADHPFLFVIREDTTGALLFVGQLHNPLVSKSSAE